MLGKHMMERVKEQIERMEKLKKDLNCPCCGKVIKWWDFGRTSDGNALSKDWKSVTILDGNWEPYRYIKCGVIWEGRLYSWSWMQRGDYKQTRGWWEKRNWADNSWWISMDCREYYAVMIIWKRFLLSGIFSGPRLTAAANNMLTMKIRYWI